MAAAAKVDMYRCHSEGLDMLVTCKVLRPEYCIDYSALEAMQQECEFLLRLHHPNVVEGYGVELEDYPRITMQHLTGKTVSAAFLSGNFEAFEFNDAADVAADVADGLTHVHEQGLLHLDVKPANVMYDNGHSTLFDFSVAEEYQQGDSLRDNAGTVEYMAPEQTHRREVGYYTDVFGLGVLFYRLLSGGPFPYELVERPRVAEDDSQESAGEPGETNRELDYSVPPVNPSGHNPQVPQEIGEVALRAVQADQTLRYANPEEFSAALEHALEAIGLRGSTP